MDDLSKLESYAAELVSAAQSLVEQCRNAANSTQPTSAATSDATTTSLAGVRDAPAEVRRAGRDVLATTTRLRALLADPDDLIQHLASQNQLLACLKWLCEFQVLAFIPLTGSVPAKDIADLADVPEPQLSRIVRMTATAGFLHEPKPGHLAHTALSAPFVTRLRYLDAMMFLVHTAAPSASMMTSMTRRQCHGERPGTEAAFQLAFKTSKTFQAIQEEQSKLHRQWLAYLRCQSDADDIIPGLLSQLDWLNLGNACIVDVGAEGTRKAAALVELYPSLHFIVQVTSPPGSTNGHESRQVSPTAFSETIHAPDTGSRITVTKRAMGAVQTVKDAAVYILHMPYSSLGVSRRALSMQILAELRAHLGVLRANPSAMLLLAPQLLPEPGTVEPCVEARARVRDLSQLQLANEREMELQEIVELVGTVQNSLGRLVVVDTLRSQSDGNVALGIKYRAYADI